jgi:hypothetical protein
MLRRGFEASSIAQPKVACPRLAPFCEAYIAPDSDNHLTRLCLYLFAGVVPVLGKNGSQGANNEDAFLSTVWRAWASAG